MIFEDDNVITAGALKIFTVFNMIASITHVLLDSYFMVCVWSWAQRGEFDKNLA